MRSFYEMMQIVEAEQDEAPQQQDQGLGDQEGGGAPPEAEQAPDMGGRPDSGEPKNYMFFSNLKVIKERAEAMLDMDPSKVDAMLEDGHDWAADHIATSKDDVEEVYNWLAGEMGEEPQGPNVPASQPSEPPVQGP